MRGIFINYRRDDAAGWAGRLVSDLRKRFRDEHVFHDIAAIGAGEDFTRAIERALGSCAVVLVMIGPKWLGARDRRGEPRLGQIDDPVRVEIRLALGRTDLLVVPVLVGGAAMPARDELPDDIGGLSTRNAAEVSDARWDFDVEQLVRQLTRIQGVAPRRQRRRTVSLILGVVALAAMALAWYVLRPSKDELTRPAATETGPRTVEPEQPLANSPLQPPIVVAKPEAKSEPARTKTDAKPAAIKPKPPKVELDGMWEPADAQGKRGRFELETRRGEVFGNWVKGETKYGLLDGKLEGDRVKFCIQETEMATKRDRSGWEYTNWRECFDGIVAGDEISFVVTNYIGHPAFSPQTRKLTVRRLPK